MGGLAAFIIIFVAGILAVAILAPVPPQPPAGECIGDSDCVAATCCHPDSCVPISQAPDCSGVLCTLDCRPGTMDCGQGHCECIGGECRAVFTGGI